MNGLGRPSVRAVFYTHKNSEQSLDQELNSVEAHKEARTARLRSAYDWATRGYDAYTKLIWALRGLLL